MPTKNYRLKVVRDGIEFEAEGDKSFVLEMLKRFEPQSPSSQQHLGKQPEDKSRDKRPAPSSTSPGKLLSIREFIQQLDLKKHTDITLAFGYYLERYAGALQFTPADINNCYYEAKMETSNTSQMIVQNIKRGYMMPSRKRGEEGKNRYTLTNTGEKFIESKLPKTL
jgi:hypothetical protein